MTHSINLWIKIEDMVSADPCLDGNHMILDHLPKRGPEFTQDDVPICDRYLQEGWYKAPNYEMVTSPPRVTYCGTLYPYWLKGKIKCYKYLNNINSYGSNYSYTYYKFCNLLLPKKIYI